MSGTPFILAPKRMKNLALKIASALQLESIIPVMRRFPDGEITLQMPRIEFFEGQECILLFEAAPPDMYSKLFELQVLLSRLQAMSCKIHIIFTYFPYLRHGEGEDVMELLKSTLKGVRVSVVEPHFPVSFVTTIPLTKPIVSALRGINLPLIISPDMGGAERAQRIASKLDTDFLVFRKKRYGRKVVFLVDEVERIKGRECVIIDDIVSTGGTLLGAYKVIQENAPQSVKAIVVHNLKLSGAQKKIKKAGIDLICCKYEGAYPYAIDMAPALIDFLEGLQEHPKLTHIRCS